MSTVQSPQGTAEAEQPDPRDPAGHEVRARLQAFFERRSRGPVRVVDYQRILGGYSRAMSRFVVQDGESRHAYVMRADPPAGTTMLATDRGREWRLMQALDRAGMPTPSARLFDATGEELGSPAILMDLVDGVSLLQRWRAADEGERREQAEHVAALTARLHALDLAQLPAEMACPASWDEYFEGQVERCRALGRAHPDAGPFLRWVACWLQENRPEPVPLTLVHGDYQCGNVLVDAAGRYSVIDWELAHVGDPREDLGYWRMAAIGQGETIVDADLAGFCAAYRRYSGLSEQAVNPASVAYFTVLGSLSLYEGMLGQAALLGSGDTSSMNVAYVTVAQPFLHGVFLAQVDLFEVLSKQDGRSA